MQQRRLAMPKTNSTKAKKIIGCYELPAYKLES